MNNNYLGRTATEKIASDIKDSSHYGSTPVVENKGNQYIKGQYDLLPNNITTASLEQDDVVSSYIKSVYSNASNGKGFSSEDRFLVDVLASTILGVDYMEVATHRDKYIPLLVGRTDLDDKGILEAWADNWQSYGYQKKLANKMNQFDKSKDEEEKMVLLEEIENINNELFKLGDYNSRNALGRGFTQSASITRQGLTTLGWTAAGALLGGGLGAIAGGATASSAIPAAVSALKTATTASKIGKAIGLTGDVIFNTFATERGSFSYELYNLVDADGNRLDDSIRNATATLGAMAVSAIEYINFPDQSINNFIKGKVAKEVVKKASIEWAKDFGMKMLKGSIGESLEEAVQSFVSDITRHMAQSYSDTTKGTKFDLRMQEEFTKYLSGAIESFASSFLPSLFAGAPGNFRESLGTYSGFKNSENIEVEKKMSYKDAKKLQNVTSETTVISFDKINLKSEAPTKQYGKTTDENGKEVDAKLDPIKVMRDPEDLSRYIPIDEDEMDKAKWLRNNRAKGIAVEIVDSNDIVSVTREAWENTVSGYSGTIEGNAITFATESEMKAFDQFAKSVGIGKSITGEYLIADENGNTVAYSASVAGSNENARAQEVLKTVEPTLVMNIKKALVEAGAKVSDRELALVSKIATAFGNLGNLTVTSENDANLTDAERQALANARGITSFSLVDGVVESAKIVFSKDANATTVVHELFHVALKTNKTARQNLVKSFKDAIRDSRESLREFYENHMEIVRDTDIQSVDDALSLIEMMSDENVLSGSKFQELLTKTFEAFWADNSIQSDEKLPSAIRSLFKELAEVFKSIYKSLTGKELRALPENVQDAYMGFMNNDINRKIAQKADYDGTVKIDKEVKEAFEIAKKNIPSDSNWNGILMQLKSVTANVKTTYKTQEDVVYEVSMQPEVYEKFRNKEWKEADFEIESFEQARFINTNEERLKDWQNLYAEAMAAQWTKHKKDGTVEHVPITFGMMKKDAEAGKVANISCVDLSTGCQRIRTVIERIENGIMPKDTPIESCYGGTCFVNLDQAHKQYGTENVDTKDLVMVTPDDIRKWFKQKATKTFLQNPTGFIRMGFRGDCAHSFPILDGWNQSLAEVWLECIKENDVRNPKTGELMKTIFITAGYAPTTEESYARLVPYKDLCEIHVSTSGWFSKNELMLRLAEFDVMNKLGLNVSLRVITDKNSLSDSPFNNSNWLKNMIFNVMKVPQHQLLGTAYHNDRTGKHSEFDQDFANQCCLTGKCASCKVGCMSLVKKIEDGTKRSAIPFGTQFVTDEDYLHKNGSKTGLISLQSIDTSPTTETQPQDNGNYLTVDRENQPTNTSDANTTEILHQDIFDTTLLEEGSARKTFDDFTEADVVAEIEAGVFMPEVVLEKYESNPIVKKELEERELLKSYASDAEKLIAARSESIGAFISQMRDYHGEAFGDEQEALYRKFYTYANTMTPQQMREWFRGEFSTIDKLMALKAMLSPRRVAKMQNGKVINALYVPKTSYVYSLIRDLNLNSSKEDVDKVLNSIKKDTNAWVKAYIRSKADYQKFRAFENNSREYLQSLAEIAYLSLSDAEFGFLRTIRSANDDGTVAETKKELRELKKELKAFGSVPEDDGTYIEASKHFYEDEIEALKDLLDEETYRVAKEKDEYYAKKIEELRKKLADKQYDAVTRERWINEKKRLEQKREAEMLLISTKNAAKIRQDKLKEKYEIRIDQLKKDKNQIISDLKIMRDLKLIEQEAYWRNSKAQAILREKNWRKISEARIKAHYDHRIKSLQLRMMYREASAKLDKNIKRKLSINLKTHDAYALETIKYVANLIVRKNYQGMDSVEFERYKTRTGKEDPDDIIFTYASFDADGNEIDEQFHYNAGAENYSKDTIPVAMLPYLSQATIDKLHSDDFAWYKLDIAEKENILDALIGVRNEAKASMEYKHAHKVKENIDISSKAVASIIKQDDPLTMEIRAYIAEKLEMKGTEPNFEQKAQTYFAQHIDEFVTPPEKPKKYLGFVASTFGHIQSIAYALDGNKEGPIYELFVNRPQRAIDKMASAVSKRNKEASEAFEVIWESGDVSRADKMKWFGAKYEISTNSLDGGKKKLTGWNLMGAYIYSQNSHGFIKLVSDKGNNISMEEMARINPEYTFKMIEEDLKQRKEFREHEVSRMEYHAKRGTQFVPQRYEGLLWTFSEVELVRIKGLIETGYIQSMMPQFAKDMGDKMIELLSKYTDDMNKAAYELYNMPFTEQRRYFPLVGYVNTKDVSLTEFMQSKKSVSHGFIQERRMNRDYELLLDPMAVFYSAIEAQERMVHLTQVVNQMNSALSPHGGNLSKVVEERYGSKMSNYLNTQLRVLAGESAYKMADWEKMANAVLQNLAVSKIGLNLMTSIKQFGSLITAMTDGEINIADFIRQFGMNRDAKASLYETLAPDLAESSVELDIARMKKANQTTKAGTKIAQIQDFSMKLTQNVDQMVKKWVWTASYMKSVEQGMNESDAAIKATALVKRTQSISSEYDLSQIQRNKSPLAKAAFMFTNDLFQMWNRLALGIPSDIKSKNYWRAFEKGLGSVMVAGFLGLAACGWLPEEEEDKFDEKSFLNDLLQNLMAFTPLVGTAMEDAVSGMRSNLSNLPTEFITLVRMPFKGSEEYELEDYVDQFYDTFIGAVGFTGLPTLTADRAMKLFFPNGIDDGFDFNAGNFAYLFVGSRAGDFFHRLADEHR